MSLAEKTVPARPRKARQVRQWDIETDVAIIGFGAAGSCAAIEAVEAGAKVDIFDLASAAGGATALSSAELYLGGSGGTTLQKALGYEETTENFFTYLMMANGPQADEDKMRAYAEGAAEHYDWMVERGVPFKESFLPGRTLDPLTDDGLCWSGNENAWPEVEHCKAIPRAHCVEIEGSGGGQLLIDCLERAVLERGVNVHLEARALTLIVDEDDAVVGVVVRIDGKELNVMASGGVVLCAGGFVMNTEMMKKYAPRFKRCNTPIGCAGDTGSGIQMGMAVGGEAINMHEGFASIPYYPPESMTYGILVNDKGGRFINEDVYHSRLASHLLAQNSERFYFILDVEAYGTYEEEAIMNADVVATAETPEELEQELGMTPNTLSHHMKVYNDHAANGEDPLFHKQQTWMRPLEPPFVALDFTPGRGVLMPYFTLGGLDTEPTGEVRRSDGSTIDGLYAAGRTACGVPRRGDGYNSGTSVGDATFSGRRAGLAAAQRAKA